MTNASDAQSSHADGFSSDRTSSHEAVAGVSSPRPLSVLITIFPDPRYDRRVQNLIAAFCKEGWEVTLVCSMPEKEKGEIAFPGVRVIPFTLKAERGPRMFLEYERKLRSALKPLGKFDIIIASDLFSLPASAAFKKEGRAQSLFYDARELYTGLPTVAHRPLVKWFWRWLERSGLKQTDRIIVTAPNDADAIFRVHHFLPKSILVRNLPHVVASLDPDRSLRQQFQISDRAIVFVYVGGLQKDRGLAAFIEAFHDIKEDTAFIVIGGGTEAASLKVLVESCGLNRRVFFADKIPTKRVINILAAADVGVSLIETNSPSYALALPSKVFEYMMAGLAVLSSDLVHVKELFQNEAWITFAHSFVKDDLALAIVQSMENASHRDARERARSLALEIYNFEREASALIENIKVLAQNLHDA